ncbi:MAG TPA: transposase [Gemmataceae bacterium]|nr:transposase [Gemmataceae bacterium]
MHIEAFALHITWTCYGTWLPGDPRGYVSNTLLPRRGFSGKENVPGTAYTANDLKTFGHARSIQKSPTRLLTLEQACIAAQALMEAAQKRQWHILRGALMANHVHIVVTNCPADGPNVRRILKGVSDAKLRIRFPDQARWWTTGGSDRYKNDQRAIDAAVEYVANQEHILVAIEDMRIVVLESK